MNKLLTLVVALLLFPATLYAQQSKKILDHDAYDIWNRIDEQAISNDGNWVLYSQSPEDGDAQLHVKALDAESAYEVARGVDAAFTADSRFAAYLVKPAKDSVRQAKIDKKKKDEMPQDGLGVINLGNGDTFTADNVKSYKLPKEAGGWIAYHLEKSSEKEEDKAEETEESEASDSKKKEKDAGTTLVLRNLNSGEETRFDSAIAYSFTEDGKWLAIATSTTDGDSDGVYAVQTASGEVTAIMEGEGNYKKLAFDEAGTQLAFIADTEDYEGDQPAFTLYYWTPGGDAINLADATTDGVPDGWWVSEHGSVSFSENGSRLYFGTAPKPAPERDEETLEEEEVELDVWNWKDPLLQPMQIVQLEREKKRTYRAVVHLVDKRVVQLANEMLPDVTVGDEGNAGVALGTSNMPYRQEISWAWPRMQDVYVVNVADGSHRLLQEAVRATPSLSPDAKYIAWWDRDEADWYVQSTAGGAAVNLTHTLPHPVYDELHDRPFEAGAYGSAGWTEGDNAFLIYDKYDIWLLDPSGKKEPINLTEADGRANDTRFRYARVDAEERAVDPDAPMLLSAMNMKTKAAGFYRDKINRSRDPQQLVMMDRMFSTPRKAGDVDKLIFTRQNFEEFGDIWTSSLNLKNMTKVSDANPQQDEYMWGTAELTEWVSLDGIPLQGILYKPEDFDASKQYPMMVYFYEKLSQNLHRHSPPATARSSISYSFYTSRGYLVFVPDIPYRNGYPGESALNAVVPGVTNLIAQGFVDADNVGVQGHSWGGYQIAYMITETDIFKAAEAGAPVVNMPSAYGGIRWASGMSRMFQYEQTQSRIGGTLWEYPMRYIDNSPLFQADKVNTPLLMMHNDDDGAVPWYQGIEYFVALRRLGKPVWMLNYNGEQHGLTQYKNKRDWAIRMQQFFDHYLKGAPAPVWMEEGVPALKKGQTLGLELVEDN
ncbi:MAG: prolyl oligopeptidase family serine peptidase [Bacteroidota bacterium]